MNSKRLLTLLFCVTLSCLSLMSLSAQTFDLRGNVTDTDGKPVIGAGVEVLGHPGIGASTDLEGNFVLSGIAKDAKIRISCIGMATKEISVEGRALIKVVMEQDTQFLDNAVVTALGIKREEKSLSYTVQEIKNDAITAVKDANFVNSLNGQVAGLAINKSASCVGGAARVVMRGAKSIEGSNNVLYVIDGIPIFNQSVGENSGIMGESRVASEGIADFNPEDVESISVLSGPSAAALYGSSAANGAILITTKRGEAGRAKLDLTSSFEASRPFVMPRFQNTYGNKVGSYESWGEKLDTPSSYNPAKDFLVTGLNLINSATLSMGTEKNYTFISLASTNASGVVPNNNYERYNITINNTSKLLKDKLELNVAAQYIKQKDRNMVSQGEYFNPIVAAYLYPRGEEWEPVRTFEYWDPSRNINIQNWPLSEGKYGLQNPYWTAYRNISENNKDRYILSASFKYDILKWLNVTGRARFDKSSTYFHRDLYATTAEVWAKGDKGHFSFSNTKDYQMYADMLINIDKSFGKFRLTSNIGASFSDFRSLMFGYGGKLHLIPNMFTIGNISPSAGVPSEGGGDKAVRNVAMFASLELGWNRIIYLTATGRNDWNSRLVNSAEPSFFYPSIGVSFLLSELVDMGTLVDMLKFRASYTQVGSPVSRIGMTPGTYTEDIKGGVIETNTIYPFGEFKAERTKSYEFGFSFKGFKGVSAEFTYYKSNTYNQTFLGSMPESSGYKYAYLQAGNVQNKGIEASLGYSKNWSDFHFGTNMVFTLNRNEIIEMVKNYKHPNLSYTFDIPEVTKGATILKVGGSINDVYANTFLKKDGNGYVYIPATGEFSLEKGDPVLLGKTTPDFTLGWNLHFGWRGLSISALFNGRFGGIVTSSTQAIMDRFGVSEDSAKARDNGGVRLGTQGIVDANKYYHMVGAQGGSDMMGFYTYDATNIRLQQMTISYKLPSKWFDGVIRGMTVSLLGNNLWMIYNKAPHDPELTPSTGTYGIGNDYFMQPSVRSFGASIKLSL